MLFRPRLQWKVGGALALMATLAALPVLAQESNFGRISLAPGFDAADGVASGYTGGSTSLPAIVANQGMNGNRCLGYGDPTPDFVLNLQQDFDQLTLQVDSGGRDTTLIVRGPDESTVRCGDDTGSNPDASIRDSNWKAGDYRIWVGSMESGAQWDYALEVTQ